MLRIRKASSAVALLLGAALLVPSDIAAAESPVPLGSGHVSDLSGVLSDAEEARLEERLGRLASAADRPELFVVLVDRFEEPSNALEWADETALLNNLAPDQYLLAIATEGRTLAISAEYGGDDTKAGPLSESRILDIEDRLGADYLRSDDWAGGIVFVADEFDKVPWPWWVWVLGIAALALLVWIVTRIVVVIKRRAERAAELRTLEGQKKSAARMLVLSDEAVRTSEQEIGFVAAEFGEETTAEFRAVLEECRARLRRGFELLTKLEDSVDDTIEETRSWTGEITRLCRENTRALDERKRSLAALRSLAEGAQKTLDRLTAERRAAATLEQDARDHLGSLSDAVPASELVGVVGNPEEIAQRLRDADTQLEKLAAAVSAHRPRAIDRAVHEVERLLAEAKALRSAIGAQADALAARRPGAGGSAVEETSGSTGPVTLEQAEAAVRAADASAQARAGRVSALALNRLNLARRQLSDARAAADAATAQRLVDSAFGLAQQVQSLIAAPVAMGTSRASTPAESGADGRLMYDSSASRSRPHWSTTTAASESEGSGGKAVVGGLSGGVVGLVSGLSLSGGESGSGVVVSVCIIVGVFFGALSGAFGSGGDGGGSSSGWGGSSHSRRSWSSSGSRSRSSSSSSRSSSSRSSGRSGGRRF